MRGVDGGLLLVRKHEKEFAVKGRCPRYSLPSTMWLLAPRISHSDTPKVSNYPDSYCIICSSWISTRLLPSLPFPRETPRAEPLPSTEAPSCPCRTPGILFPGFSDTSCTGPGLQVSISAISLPAILLQTSQQKYNTR